ncbi:Dabb family protein [Streptomyces sp. SID3343]|uniref:Dabb family protein n=1 Tax=Streptomyces sp. SID3343 TaxID=2690260 RepID=UPI0013707B6B|nr:Dabb family protein [Streptomyces sp. SID3343]MYW05709.1 Dabb family protein [Streptomyces sp. SID3343]
MSRLVVLAAHAPDLAAGPGTISAGPDLPGTVGGRGYSWDLTDRPLPHLPEGADAVALRPVRDRFTALEGPRVKRTLLLTVRAGTPADVVAEFESDLMAMPDHITTIGSWALSRVEGAVRPSRWTHAWEQEYATVEGLTGEYLLNPYHWAYVDRWFDAEMPGVIVEPRLAHVFRWSDAAVLATATGDRARQVTERDR